MNKVLTSDFKYYCEKNFKKIIVNEKELTIPQILQFNEFFLGSLTQIKPKHEPLIEEFSNLLQIISSKSSSSELLYESLLNVIQCILIVSPKTRTEMMFHLVKYSNHETVEEQIKAWQCIALVSNYICLQENFTLYFLNFIYGVNSSSESYIIKKYSAFSFVNFLKNKNLGERSVLPVLSHIKEILKLNKLYLRIYVSHEKFVDLYVELYQTVEEAKFHMLKTLEIPKEYHTYFGIYEVIETEAFYEETFIEEFVRCSDVLASFEISKSDLVTSKKDQIITNKLGYSTEANRLYLRVRYYYQNPEDIIWTAIQDTFAITEIWRLIICNRIILDKESLYNIIALKLKFIYPKMGIRFITALLSDINKNIQVLGKNSNLRVYANQEIILKKMKNYDKNSLEDLKIKTSKIFEKNPLYKTQSFEVELKEDLAKLLNFPSKLILLLGSDRLHLCKINLEKIKTILYCTIEKIFLKNSFVVIAINNDMPSHDERELLKDKQILEDYHYYFANEKKIKYFFKSNQAKKIYQTVINYIKLKLNGFYEQTQIKRNTLYKDTYQIVHNIPLLEKVKQGAKPVYKINRYFKKIVFN